MLKKAKSEFELRKEQYRVSNSSWRKTLEARYRDRQNEMRQKYNMTIEEYLEYAMKTLREKRTKLDGIYRPKLLKADAKVNDITNLLWIILNCLFILGGIIGSLNYGIIT